MHVPELCSMLISVEFKNKAESASIRRVLEGACPNGVTLTVRFQAVRVFGTGVRWPQVANPDRHAAAITVR